LPTTTPARRCTLHALGRRHDLSRNLIRIWIENAEASSLDQDMASAELLTECETRIAALERWSVARALEIELSQRGAQKNAGRREARLHPRRASPRPLH
jgi:transposase